jgi:uncharacterized iron-regulated membrane protein
MFEMDPETRRYVYYGLMTLSVLFLVFVFGVRYLTRNQDHTEEEEED